VLDELREMLGPGADQQAAQIAQRAARDGLQLNYDRAIATGTFDAHRLILLASRHGHATQMVERLFRAHFTDGLHVGDPETLRALADEIGVVITDDADEELRRRLDLPRRNGIQAIPVLIFDNRPALVGVQSEERLLEVLQQQARVGSPN
jgi:predicted DsbA family dithiol-disulfide isomerase